MRLRSIDDTLRQHAKIIREAKRKGTDPDVMSRMLGRHASMLETRYVQTLAEEIKTRNALEAKRVIQHESLPAIAGTTDEI